MNNDRSHDLFTRAQQLMPGGVNSPVRAFKSVGGEPFFVQRADGPYLFDVDGNRYIDYVGSWGPMIVGHNHPKVLDAVIETARNGLSFGTPNPLEVTMAETITRLMPELRDGAHGQLRHRGHAVGDPPGARRDRAQPHRQVRRLLPRPRRLVPGEGRQRRADLRRADLAGRAEGAGRPDLTLTYNDFDGATALFDEMRRRDRLPDRRAGGRQCQLPAAARRLPAAPARPVHASTARC
jgi:hypothetical protein